MAILNDFAVRKIQNATRVPSSRMVGLRYLPPYGPDLNLIDLAPAKLDTHLRQAASSNLDALHSALAAALNAFAPQHCPPSFVMLDMHLSK
jgi:transposase